MGLEVPSTGSRSDDRPGPEPGCSFPTQLRTAASARPGRLGGTKADAAGACLRTSGRFPAGRSEPGRRAASLRSLEHFTTAAARARDSGAVKDETIWLNNLGLVNFQTNQLTVAEKYYIQSLDLGQKTQNSERTLASLTALAFLYIKSNRLNQAMQYSQHAFELAHRMGDRSDELYALLAEGTIAPAT